MSKCEQSGEIRIRLVNVFIVSSASFMSARSGAADARQLKKKYCT